MYMNWESDGADGHDAVVAQVIAKVAAREGVDPIDLPPLYTAIDTDALTQLFDTRVGGAATGHITFQYHGYDVTVSATGEVTLSETDSGSATPMY